ncbi:MAG: hypothetical protein GF329_03705 [Candidatus Lokiarchaeota archaeon]|nr:hypothetical protein [Candidatus Lokiarchaeota archaeon]
MPPKLFKFNGSVLKHFNNELECAEYFKSVLKKSMRLKETGEIIPGLLFSRTDLINYLDDKLLKGEPIYYLHENGVAIDRFLNSLESKSKQKLNFLIGDQSGFEPKTSKYLSKNGKKIK